MHPEHCIGLRLENTPDGTSCIGSNRGLVTDIPNSIQARIQDFLKGGGGEAPPLGHCPCDVIHIPRGGGDRSRSRTLCIGFQYQDKFKGGG